MNTIILAGKKILLFTIFLLLLIAAGVAVYRGLLPQETVIHESTDKKDPITIGLIADPTAFLAVIASEKGFFSQSGLDVSIKNYPSGKRAVTEGLFAGEVDIAVASEAVIVFNSFKRNDFKTIASIGSSDNEPRIIARKDSGIRSPSDLRGKRIATQEASAVHFFLHLFLVKNNLSEKDISLSFKKAEELPKALASGEIDAFSMREPFIGETRRMLGDNAVVFSDLGLYTKTSNILVLTTFINDKPEVIIKVLNGLLLAEEFATNHREQAITLVSNKFGIEKSKSTLLWADLDLSVSLTQGLLYSLSDEARWVINSSFVDYTQVPNYLDFIYLDALNVVRPGAITVFH